MATLKRRLERLEAAQGEGETPALLDWTPTPDQAAAVFDILAEVLSPGDLEALILARGGHLPEVTEGEKK